MDPKDAPGPKKVNWQEVVKCRYCGGDTTLFHSSTFNGACEKRACVLLARQGHDPL